jgi:hypothetical protein
MFQPMPRQQQHYKPKGQAVGVRRLEMLFGKTNQLNLFCLGHSFEQKDLYQTSFQETIKILSQAAFFL